MWIVRRNRFPDGVGNLPTISQAIFRMGVPTTSARPPGDFGQEF
jgi:hypothetical protein